MPETRLDVLCIGNAIVDVIANASDDFLTREGLAKGSMRLIDAEEAERLYGDMGPATPGERRIGGQHRGGVAALGGRAGFIGQVAPDQLGDFLSPRPDERWRGVHHAGRGRRRAHGTIDDPRDSRRPPDDEHLPRRCPASAGERPRRGADRPSEDPLSRRLFVGSGDAALRDAARDRGRPRRPAAKSPSPSPTPSASTATATASTLCSTSGGSTSSSPIRRRSKPSPECRISTPPLRR